MPREERIPARQRGVALIIMLVLITMGVLYFVVNGVSIVGMQTERQRITNDALMQARQALFGYAATYRDNNANQVFGYLPCPDNDGDGSANAFDCGGADGRVVIGLLPYRQLGLPNNLDSDGNCLWYAVSGTFKASTAPLPVNWDTQGQIEIRDANDNLVAQPDDANGGAAAVIFSVGAPLVGQNRLASSAAAPCGISAAAVASANYARYIDIDPTGTDHARSQPFPGAPNATIRVALGTPQSSINNDRILAISPREIFDLVARRADFKAALTAIPPGHINNLLNKVRIAVETQMQGQLDTATAPPIAPTGVALPNNQASYNQFPATSKLIGDLDPTIPFSSNSDGNWFASWRNQARLVTCADIATPCVNFGTQQCRGALLFSGRNDGGPRPSAQMVAGTANLGFLFEPGQGLDILNSAISSFSGQGFYTAPNDGIPRNPGVYSDPYDINVDRSFDVGICLFPGTFLSFNNGIGNFIAESGLTANAPVAIDTTARTITLGNTAASGTNSGCAWSPATPFNTSLRAYFTFNITDRGEGFTFAVADAATNSPTGTLCGDGGNALGYSGSGLAIPKLGLEIDTRRSTAKNDPGTFSRPDHVAFLYWGTTALASDDNVHGAPPPAGVNGTQPLNPRGLGTLSIQAASWVSNVATVTIASPPPSHYFVPNQTVTISGITPSGYNGTFRIMPVNNTAFTFALDTDPGMYVSGGTVASPFYGIATVKTSDPLLPHNGVLPTNTNIHVRIDITRVHSGTTGTYRMAAYVVSTPEPEGVAGSCVTLSNLRNLSFDMENLACARGPTVSQREIVIDDLPGLGAALSSVYAGFTNGQTDSAGEQVVTISNFLLRAQ